MRFELIEPGHPLHPQALALRHALLRAPLGLPPGSERYAHEDACWQGVLVDEDPAGDEVVATLLFHPDGRGGGRLLQMGVARERQGQGLGARLLRAMEAALMARGVRHAHLHARQHALGFYAKLGYDIEGEPFVEVGLPHRMMSRTLAPAGRGEGKGEEAR